MASRAQTETDWKPEADWALPADRTPTADRKPQAGRSVEAGRKQAADWSAYAATYDMLLEHNPAYQQLLDEFEAVLASEPAPEVIYDVGGGTGNYAEVAAKHFPESTIYFVEPDYRMSSYAAQKLSAHEKVVFMDRPFQAVEAPDKADLVICTHALYTMPDPQDRLEDLRGLLQPGGLLFLVDLGRPMDVADWRSYLFAHLTQEFGIAKALRILWKGREIAKQNKAIFRAQQENLYWTHSSAEITSAVEKAGFTIEAQKVVYRGYSDLLLCRAAV